MIINSVNPCLALKFPEPTVYDLIVYTLPFINSSLLSAQRPVMFDS